jgi:signal transduction histidine kinase
MTTETETEKLRHLMEVGRRLLAELDPDEVFAQVLAEARAITGARYAALGVLSESRTELSRFLTDGIDTEGRRVIGDLPRGRGVLGVLIEHPVPLRLDTVGSHPQSFGFPMGHPDMGSFLGVPILIRGRAWGNLYLTEKADGERFTEADEAAALILAEFAATAIQNARIYQRAEGGRQDLVRAVRGLEAARTISDAIGAEADLETILELIVKRGRALVSARSVMIMLVDGQEMVVAAGTGSTGDRRGTRTAIAGTVSGEVLLSGAPLRVDNLGGDAELRDARVRLGAGDARTALVMPMIHRGEGIGVLIALDRGAERGSFSDADEELMHTFASSAANAVAISHSVEADRLRATIESAEDERRRWARELHDQTLQALGGLRVQLSGARRHDQLDIFREAVGQAIADLEFEIQNLRGIISDLRPPLLDDLGLPDALAGLVERHRDAGLPVDLSLDLDRFATEGTVIPADLETAVYRLIQEALTNVVKHAQARSVDVRVTAEPDAKLSIEVIDDGVGFDPGTPGAGFGLGSIRERVYLAGGSVDFESGPGGTAVRAQLPVLGGTARRAPAGNSST